jgi:hypothetical protein
MLSLFDIFEAGTGSSKVRAHGKHPFVNCRRIIAIYSGATASTPAVDEERQPNTPRSRPRRGEFLDYLVHLHLFANKIGLSSPILT